MCSVSSRGHLIRVFEVGLLTCNFSSTIKRTYIWGKKMTFFAVHVDFILFHVKVLLNAVLFLRADLK